MDQCVGLWLLAAICHQSVTNPSSSLILFRVWLFQLSTCVARVGCPKPASKCNPHFALFPQVHNTLDPLLEALTREYIDDEDLSLRLRSLFKVRG